jgi:hypothetical protein
MECLKTQMLHINILQTKLKTLFEQNRRQHTQHSNATINCSKQRWHKVENFANSLKIVPQF